MQNFLSQAPPQTSLNQEPKPQITENPKPKFTNPKYDRNYSKEQITLVFSYLNANPYFQNLKKQHKYVHWMSTEQKRKLLIQSYAFLAKSDIASQIQSIQKQTAQNHNLQKIKIVVIVLYGKLSFNGKAYGIGQWAELSSPLNTLVEDKCVCLMFQQNIFQAKLSEFNFFHFKKALFKKYFLQKAGIDLPSKKIDDIIHSLKFNSSTQKILIDHRKPQFDNPGIFILIKGDFLLLDLQNKICVGELKESYVGQESLWGKFQYNLKSKQNIWEFLFCPKQLLITCLNEQKYQQIKYRLFEIYEKKKENRKKRQYGLFSLYKQFKDSKEKTQTRVKAKIDIEKCQETLEKIRKLKPKWMEDQEKKYKKTKNKRKNIFTQPSDDQKSKRKYFSVKTTKIVQKKSLKQKSPQQKQLFTRHFSSMKTEVDSTVAATPLHSTRSNKFMNQTADQKGFSKFARTSFYQQGNKTGRSYYSTPHKVKSEPKRQKNHNTSESNQLDKWDVEYSKKYDRSLSWSVRKERNLVKVVKFKQKVFPKQRAQFFTIQDATEALEKSFYDLERLRRLDEQEKNKRAFQKVFKQKMLIMDSSRRNPLIFR